MLRKQYPTVKIVKKVVPAKKVVRLQQGGLVTGKPNSLPSRPTGKKKGVRRIYYG